MASKSSFHAIAVKANSESHNLRESKLDYVYEDLSKNNESWVDQNIHDRLLEIQKHCKKVSGRKMQKNATPIREAVVNLNGHHTMDDLKQLGQELEQTYGIRCFQIHIHRDEGKDREHLNHHAHMVFDWQNKEKGTMKRLLRKDLSQLQTTVAETLGMERGVLKENSNREHLAPVEFKRVQEEKKIKAIIQRVEKFEKRSEDLIEKKTKFLFFKSKDWEATRENINLFVEKTLQEAREFNRRLKNDLKKLLEYQKRVEKEKEVLKNQNQKLKTAYLKFQKRVLSMSPDDLKKYQMEIMKSVKEKQQEKRPNRGMKR